MLLQFRTIIALLLLSLFYSYSLFAQQNLFNIPSGDITPKGKVFFQQQINSYSVSEYESKSHFVYGISKHIDMGVNFVNLPISFSRGINLGYNDERNTSPLYPAVLFTGQSKIDLSKKIHINTGFLAGFNVPIRNNNIKPLYKLYGIMNLRLSEKIRILGGPYYSNPNLVGEKHNFGMLLGYEIFLTKRFYLMGDYISGRNTSSAVVIGANYNVTKRVQLCLGGLLATPQKQLKPGIVFEINILGYDLDEHH